MLKGTKKDRYVVELSFNLVNDVLSPKKVKLNKVIAALEDLLDGEQLLGHTFQTGASRENAFFQNIRVKEIER